MSLLTATVKYEKCNHLCLLVAVTYGTILVQSEQLWFPYQHDVMYNGLISLRELSPWLVILFFDNYYLVLYKL